MIERSDRTQPTPSREITLQERFEGGMLGLACGDAVGTTLEFQSRGSFEPIGDMVGGGPFSLKVGQWTDDTSMALCLAESLIEKQGFHADDQMQRYLQWYRNGYMSSTGRCFDIGNTVRAALERYEQHGEFYAGSTHAHSAGNGSLMRLLPVILFYYPDQEQARHYASQSSRTTHGAEECLEACKLFSDVICGALSGLNKEEILASIESKFSSERIQAIANGDYREKSLIDIKGSGYVVESLEAALYCFWKSDSYKEAILMAANLGDDADTTAAICGQIAGAYYGVRGVPEEWLTKVHERENIELMARKLYQFK